MRNVYNIFVGKCEGKRPLGGCGHRWEDNITMDHRKVAWEAVDWARQA
jgi:hypothetical protein